MFIISSSFAEVSRKGRRERKVKKFFIKNIAADTHRQTQGGQGNKIFSDFRLCPSAWVCGK